MPEVFPTIFIIRKEPPYGSSLNENFSLYIPLFSSSLNLFLSTHDIDTLGGIVYAAALEVIGDSCVVYRRHDDVGVLGSYKLEVTASIVLARTVAIGIVAPVDETCILVGMQLDGSSSVKEDIHAFSV